jgi:hypothetical protein
MNFIEEYDYVIMDLKTGQRQTFSYEFFKDGKWSYPYKKHMTNLGNLVQTMDSWRREKREVYGRRLNCSFV